MKRFSLVIVAAIAGALFVSLSAEALPLFANVVQWVSGSSTKSASSDNPLPVTAQGSGYPAWGADTATAITSGTSVRTGPLTAGKYAVACNNTMFGDQGDSSVTATVSERRVPANFVYPLNVTGSSDTYVALIGTMGGGTCIFSLDSY